ncbi:unnamed protein product, partial [Boreogadus saida]
APQGYRDHQVYQGLRDTQDLGVKLVNQEESSMQLAPALWASQAPPVLLDPLDLPDPLDYQVPLALLVFLAQLVCRLILIHLNWNP